MPDFFNPKQFSELYYIEKNHAAQYTSEPTGVLDALRLVQGHARYWQKPIAVTVHKKKTLIFADWSAKFWSFDYLFEVRMLLNDLIRAGFIIYYWDSDSLINLHDGGILESDVFMDEITAVDKQTLLNGAMQQHRLMHDQVFILDRYQLMKLLGYPEERLRAIDGSLLERINQADLPLIQAVDEKEPSTAIQFVILDEEDTRQKVTTWPAAVINKVELTPCNVQKFSVDATWGTEFFEPLRSKLNELVQGTDDFALVLGKSRHSLDTIFSSSQVIDWIRIHARDRDRIEKLFNHLHQHAVNVTSLHLIGSILRPPISIAPLNQPLHSLVIENGIIDVSYLMPLLQGCKHLYLNNSEFEGSTSFDNLDLISLIINGSEFHNLESFLGLIHGSLHLRELRVDGILPDDLLKLRSPNLEVLTSISVNISSQLTLSSVLNQFPLLRMVSIVSRGNLFFNNELISAFNRIETVKLRVSYGYSLADAISLTIDKLNHVETEIDQLYFDGVLTSLKTVELFIPNDELSFEENKHLNALLKASKALKCLSIGVDEDEDDRELPDYYYSWLEDGSLPESIESLYIIGYGIAFGALVRILKALPNLTSLRFDFQDKHTKDFVYNEDDDEQLQWYEGKRNPEFQALMKRLTVFSLPAEYDYRVESEWVFNSHKRKRDDLSDDETSDNHPDETIEYTRDETPGISPKRQKMGVDANTSLMDMHYNLNEVFYALNGQENPHPSMYRLTSYNQLSFNPRQTGLPFELANVGELDLTDELPPEFLPFDCNVRTWANEHPHVNYYAKEVLQLNTEWQPIASLSPQEMIYGIKWTPPYPDVEVNYSRRDNLYYVHRRTTDAQSVPVTLEFGLSVLPFAAINLNVPQYVNDTALAISQFGVGPLLFDNPTQPPHAYDYLVAMMNQKVGACRHRAILFKSLMSMNCPDIPVRVIDNNCHMFVEVKCGDYWLTYNLGGYPASLTVHKLATTEDLINSSQLISEKPIPISARQLEFEHRLATWHIDATNVDKGMDGFIRSLKSTQLIHMPAHQVLDLVIAIQEHLVGDSSQPVFYIHSPDDLVCSAPFIERTGNRGELRRITGGGGPLHYFLTQSRENSGILPLLLVNYTQFAADDFVRFNALIDVGNRFADGTPLSPQTRVLGFIDPMRPGAYTGADFYSRFEKVINVPMSIPACPLPWSEPPEGGLTQDAIIINLCHSPTWLRMLVGGWEFDQEGLVFIPGALIEALSASKPIIIENPPNDALFVYFWQQARLHGYIEACGERIELEKTQCLHVREGYDWSKALSRLNWTDTLCEKMLVLNPSRLTLFLNRYTITEQHGLASCAGFIAEYAKHLAEQPLQVFVSRRLSEDEWGLFFKELARFPSLRVNIAYAPGVSFPEAFGGVSTRLPSCVLPTQCVHTDDAEVTVARILRTKPDTLVWDVSECSAADLLVKISAQVLDNGVEVFESDRALTKALRENNTVVLTGHFSDELLDALAPMLLERLINGGLYLVSEDPIAYLEVARETIDFKQRVDELKRQGFSELECENVDAFQTESLVRLRTRLHYHRLYPEALVSEDAWAGFVRCGLSHTLPAIFSVEDSDVQAHAFMQARLDAVSHVLNYSPYVFLAGLTGVGKSRFVDNELAPFVSKLVYGDSDESLRAWATAQLDDNDSKWCVLFLDEANLSPKQWSHFEGLFQVSPGVLIDGEYFALTLRHKVIFAGNPLSYGDRQTAALFSRHGNSIVFQPLSAAVVYVKTIKPLLEAAGLTDIATQTTIATQLLNVYNYVIALSTKDVLISPRQIQMMTLLVLSDYASHPHVNLANLAKYHAFRIGLDLVPEYNRLDFLRTFEMPLRESSQHLIDYPGFIPTPSREQVLSDLLDFMQLRNYQRDKRFNTLEKHPLRYGGLNCFIIEGEPGQGKSELLVALLSALGLREAPRDATQEVIACGNYWYRVSPCMSYPVLREIVLRAFDAGAVVVIDEMNSMPSLEGLLNGLLEGYHPDEQNRLPKHPGFKVIGTQNPATSAGRRMDSLALANRTLKRTVLAYTPAEMKQLLAEKYSGLNPTAQDELVSAFNSNVGLARLRNLTPPPSFRDLLRLAETVEREVGVYDGMNSIGFFAPFVTSDENQMVYLVDEDELYFSFIS